MIGSCIQTLTDFIYFINNLVQKGSPHSDQGAAQLHYNIIILILGLSSVFTYIAELNKPSTTWKPENITDLNLVVILC